jgi:hypothetical protein
MLELCGTNNELGNGIERKLASVKNEGAIDNK